MAILFREQRKLMGKLPRSKNFEGRPGKRPEKQSSSVRTSQRGHSRGPKESPGRKRPVSSSPRFSENSSVFPIVEEDVALEQLDRYSKRELMALQKENADWVGKHLVMAGRILVADPALAHEHARAAFTRAARIPIVRETLGITAYLVGDYSLALRELRTFRRMSGSDEVVPLMVDCERALGRPRKGLLLAGEISKDDLSPHSLVELAIARSGARIDLGELELALRELEIPQLNPKSVFEYSPSLFDSYASVMSLLGRNEEASEWGDLANRAAHALNIRSGARSEELEVVDLFWGKND